MTIKETSQKEAENKLNKILAYKYKVNSLRRTTKIFSKLLFQSARDLSKISKKTYHSEVIANSKTNFKITKDNINSYSAFKGRNSIKPDFFGKNALSNSFYIGEAKGTKDKTGQYGGSTFSCAHKIIHKLILDNNLLRNNSCSRFTHSFLSQSLGYLDAINHFMTNQANCSNSEFNLYFAWLICDYNPEMEILYKKLGKSLVDQIHILFDPIGNILTLEEFIKEDVSYFYLYKFDCKKIKHVTDTISNSFISTYFKDNIMTNQRNKGTEDFDDDFDPRMIQSSPAVEICLSGLGVITHSISQIFRYKYEIKHLESEADKLEKNLSVRKKAIDSTLKLELKKLDDRRRIIEKGLSLVSQELRQNHIERKGIIQVFGKLSEKLTDVTVSLEDKKEVQTALSTCSTLLTDLGSKGSTNLSSIVDNTKNSLKSLPQNIQYLLDSGSVNT